MGKYKDNDHIKKGIYVSGRYDYCRVKMGRYNESMAENLGAGAGSEDEIGRGGRIPGTRQPGKE
jgi:hypothetical protein